MSDEAIMRLEAWLRAYGEIKQREFTADLRAVLQLARDGEMYRKRAVAAEAKLCRLRRTIEDLTAPEDLLE